MTEYGYLIPMYDYVKFPHNDMTAHVTFKMNEEIEKKWKDYSFNMPGKPIYVKYINQGWFGITILEILQ